MSPRVPALSMVEIERWNRQNGAVIVGCGYKIKAPDGWFNGHVVAFAEGYMIDLSLDQFSRPHQGIDLDLASTRVSPAFKAGEERAVLVTDTECLVVYEPHDDYSFEPPRTGVRSWTTKPPDSRRESLTTSTSWRSFRLHRHRVS